MGTKGNVFHSHNSFTQRSLNHFIPITRIATGYIEQTSIIVQMSI